MALVCFGPIRLNRGEGANLAFYDSCQPCNHCKARKAASFKSLYLAQGQLRVLCCKIFCFSYRSSFLDMIPMNITKSLGDFF